MIEKLQKLIEFFSQYPTWVVITSSSLIFCSTLLLIVFRPTSSKSNRSTSLDTSSNLEAMLVISTSAVPHTDAAILRSVWSGPVTAITEAKKEDFINAIKRGYSILHVEAQVEGNQVIFDDGPLSAKDLQEVLCLYPHLNNTRLVVLSACNSFRVGKALENSRIQYSLVSLSSLRVDIAETFYKEFYEELAQVASVEQAYERAVIHTNVRHNIDAREQIMLTRYDRIKD